MVRKFFKKALLTITNQSTGRVDMATCSGNEVSQFIRKSQDVQLALRDFVGSRKINSTFISLGENCNSAWYLKQVGLKKESYPFDWIFSSPEIIIDCINDEFEKYLKKSFIVPKRKNKSAGHKYYHSNFFNHRNPLKSEKDYKYYERCCERFIHKLKSQKSTYYLITLINEPSKRAGWANGFNDNFSMPINYDYKTAMPLFNKIRSINKNSKFIVVNHYTDSNRDVEFQCIDSDIISITFNSHGSNTGVFYMDYLDDFCFKLVMSGLHGYHDE